VFDLIGGTSTGGGAGNRITDSGTIATITNNANYNDSYGNPTPPCSLPFSFLYV